MQCTYGASRGESVDISRLRHAAKKAGGEDWEVVTTAWVDNKRAVGPKGLSVIGSNISDQQIRQRSGPPGVTVRTSNGDETLGVVRAKDVFAFDASSGRSVDLATFLNEGRAEEMLVRVLGAASFSPSGSEPGSETEEKTAAREEKVFFRYQSTFFRAKEGGASIEAAPHNYSYQTRGARGARNVHFLFTPEGIYAHVDKPGWSPLLAQQERPEGSGRYESRWFEIKKSGRKVGVGEAEVEAMREEAPSREATEVRIPTGLGIAGSGPGVPKGRFLVVTVPLVQTKDASLPDSDSWYSSADEVCEDVVYRSLAAVGVSRAAFPEPEEGDCFVGEVAVGSMFGQVETLASGTHLVRDKSAPIVVTMLDYSVLEEGANVVREEDVERVVRWGRFLYEEACFAHGKMSTMPEILEELTSEVKASVRPKSALLGLRSSLPP